MTVRWGWIFWLVSIPILAYWNWFNDALYVRLTWAFLTGFAMWLFIFGKSGKDK